MSIVVGLREKGSERFVSMYLCTAGATQACVCVGCCQTIHESRTEPRWCRG